VPKDGKVRTTACQTERPYLGAARSRVSAPGNPSFYSLKIHLQTGFRSSIYVGSSSGNWVEGQKSLTPSPKLKALTRIPGRYRSGQTGQTVNLLAYAFSGSNPLLPMRLMESRLRQPQYHGKEESIEAVVLK
jgi:hypothetical protein